MRTYFLILISLVWFSSLAQNSEIPIELKITNDLIVFTLPPPYHKAEYKPIAKPRFVATLRTLVMKEHNPSKKEMLEILQSNLAIPPAENSDEERLAYLKNICLFIYLGNNCTLQLPEITRELVSKWTADDAFRFIKEAKLVSDYISFGDEMTVKFQK